MTTFRDNLRGILAISASQFVFILNDTLVKLSGEALPLGEIVAIRGLIAAVLIGAVAVALGDWRRAGLLRHRTIAWRTLGEIGATISFLTALFMMPIASVTVIFQAMPLAVTAGAALFLSEKVGWRRWTAITVGFIGVIVVMKPTPSGFDVYALVVLVAVFFASLRDLQTRALPAAIPTILVTALTALAVAIVGFLIGTTEDWVVPGPLVLLELAGAAICLSIGYFTVIMAMRIGDMSVTAPFRYTVIVWAIALGYLVWGDVPDAAMLIGSTIIVGSGVYTFYRERRVSRTAAAAAPPTTP